MAQAAPTPEAEDDEQGERGQQRGPQQDHGARLPPPVEWDVPPVPRRWLRQLQESAAAKADRARGRGNDAKAEKAEAEQRRLDEWIKQTGGTGESGLEFKIKAEKSRLARSQKAAEKVQGAIRKVENDIKRLQAEIDELRNQEQWHVARCETLKEQITYMSAQLHAEAMPTRESELQRARARMQEIGDPAFAVVLDMLDTMVPPEAGAQLYNLAEDDTSSSDVGNDDDQTDLEMGGDEHDAQRAAPAASGPANAALAEARGRLATILKARAAALDSAKAAQRRKRSSDGEEKSTDYAGDAEMVGALSASEVESFFAVQLAEAEATVQRLEALVDDEVPVVPPAEPQRGQHQARDGDADEETPTTWGGPAALGSAGGASTHIATAGTTGAHATAGDIEDQIIRDLGGLAAAATTLQDITAINQQIMEQNREQAVQDEESERLRYEANGVDYDAIQGARTTEENNRRAAAAAALASPLATFGPTGAPLMEQQLALRRAGAEGTTAAPAAGRASSPAPRARSTRWERVGSAESQAEEHEGRPRSRSKSPRGGRGPRAADTMSAD